MHILLLPSERYVSPDEPFGGIFQYHQAHALKKSGLRVGVVAFRPRSLRQSKSRFPTARIEFDDSGGIPVYRYQGWNWIPGRVPYFGLWYSGIVAGFLVKRYFAEQGKPDLIHAHNALYAGVIAAKLKEKYGMRYVLTEHSSAYVTGNMRRWQKSMAASALRNADQRLAVSKHLCDVLYAQYGLHCEYVPNILDARFEALGLKSRGGSLDNKGFTFLNVGRLIEVKNQESLLDAFSMRFKGVNGICLRIGGSGPLRQKLETKAKNLGITEQVFFLGKLSREQVLEEMLACDCFVLSSRYETFGVVLIEALACGKPVIAVAKGGVADIVHERNGILVAPENNDGLAQAMSAILNRRYDPVMIRDDCIRRFGETRVVALLSDVYERVVADQRDLYMLEKH